MNLLGAGFAALGVGVLLLIAFHRYRTLCGFIAAFSNLVASVCFFIPSVSVLRGGATLSHLSYWGLPFANLSLKLDPLAAFFLIPLFLLSAFTAVYGVGYLKGRAEAQHLGYAWAAFNLLVAGMAIVILASNALLFILGWEVTAISSFLLVLFDHHEAQNRLAAWLYLVASHLGAAFIIVMFLVLGSNSGSLEFDLFNTAQLTPATTGFIFVLAVIGFGTKAGFIPLHVWLPEAHPAAPSHVSALMSGVMIKTGIYGIMRVLFVLQTSAAWWGWLILLIGAISGILGVLFALAQHDLKRLLAYHSVENIGIIALGIGLGILGLHAHNPLVAILAFSGGLLHVLNHAVFKSLLFLGAGSVLHATGTRDIDALGGLSKSMPVTSASFLTGSMAISGLPPLNGFVSEFLIYYGAFSAIAAGTPGMLAPALIAIVSLGLIGGLAAACFAKAFSVVFLGVARSQHAEKVHECGLLMSLPMIGLALSCGLIALFSPSLVLVFSKVLNGQFGLTPLDLSQSLSLAAESLSYFLTATFLFLALLAAAALLRRALLSGREVRSFVTWDCGYARPEKSMQYTGSSFAQPLVSLFRPVLFTGTLIEGFGAIFPGRAKLHTETPDFFHHKLFSPIFTKMESWYGKLRWIQHGILQFYVLYIALTLAALLVWELR